MTHSVRRAVSSIVIGGALCMGLIFPTQAGAQTAQGNVEEMAIAVDKASAGEPGSDTEVASIKAGSRFEAKLDDATIKIPQHASEGVVVTKKSGADANESITIGIGEDKQQTGQLAADGSVVYEGDNVGKTVQATKDGVRISTVIKSAEADTEYIHQLKLPDGAKVMKASEYPLSAEDAEKAKASEAVARQEQGAATANPTVDPIIIVDKNNKFLSVFAEAWAKDANGKEIPTSYEIRDGALVQKVDHKQQGVQYPVVADPYGIWSLIDSAKWVEDEKGKGWVLAVSPTLVGRSINILTSNYSYLVGVVGWEELYEKYGDKGRGIKANIGSMRNQYICHQEWAFLKPFSTWNLEEWRAEVSYEKTVDAKCNP
ncbi:DUF2599 domain-containing protein [Corynebacterium durum]